LIDVVAPGESRPEARLQPAQGRAAVVPVASGRFPRAPGIVAMQGGQAGFAGRGLRRGVHDQGGELFRKSSRVDAGD